MSEDFLYRTVPALDRRVHRIGLASSFGLGPAGFEAALDAGLNYIFWTPRMKKITPVLRDRLRTNRDSIVIATGPTTGWFGSHVRASADRLRKILDIDTIDVLQLFWLGKTSAWTEGTTEALQRLKEEGVVRCIGTSIHDRPRAGRMARDKVLDMLMVRYNAAHPGAEVDIFPHVDPKVTATIAYTATRWRKLLKRPRKWEGRVPTAADCYRFCLSHPSVDITLMGPKNLDQLNTNLRGLAQGPMDGEEMDWMRAFGRAVRG